MYILSQFIYWLVFNHKGILEDLQIRAKNAESFKCLDNELESVLINIPKKLGIISYKKINSQTKKWIGLMVFMSC